MNTISTTLYCCLRYAIAPFLTYSAISLILGVPSSDFIIVLKKYHAIDSATTDAMGTSQKTSGILFMILKIFRVNKVDNYLLFNILNTFS